MNLDAILGGIGLLVKGGALTVVDTVLAINSDKEYRWVHITAIALDILVIFGASLTIAGGAHGNAPLIMSGFVCGALASLIRLIFFLCVEKVFVRQSVNA